jgi:glucokinase
LKAEIAAASDPPAAISRLAQESKAAICDQTLSLFVSAYGAHAGDCALTFMSMGGIFIGGSIAAKNLAKMQEPTFMEAFLDKGRMAGLLKDVPVKIVLNDDAGMMGAARYTLIQKAFDRSSRGTV